MNKGTKVKDNVKTMDETTTKDEMEAKDTTHNKMEKDKHQMMSGSYARFGAMIATSTAVMFILMYLNTYALDHVYFSETRFYIMFVMGATMAVIMLLFMLDMYKNTKVNLGIIAGSVVIFILALWLVRSQTTVEDVSWMKAMYSASLDSDFDQRTRQYFRSARAEARQQHYRSAAQGN